MCAANDLHTRNEIRRFFIVGFWTLLLETILCLYIARISGSATIFTFMLQNCFSLLIYFFAIIALGLSIKDNTYKFPYGTGRLENFISFFQAALNLPGACLVYYSIWESAVNVPESINYEYTQISFIYINIRLIVLKWWAKSIMRRTDVYSPILKAYDRYYTVCIIESTLSAITLLVAFVLQRSDRITEARYIDIAVSAFFGTYMIVNALIVIKENFVALIDLPLKEADQLLIMKTLAEHFDLYEGVGYVYSRMSGRKRIIEIGLRFSPDKTVSEIVELQAKMTKDLEGHFSDFTFNLLPAIH